MSWLPPQGKSRADIAEVGSELGLDGTYLPQSYIEQVQINKLTADFSKITESLKREISIVGETSRHSLDETMLGKSPPCFAQISTEMSRSMDLREELGSLGANGAVTKTYTAPCTLEKPAPAPKPRVSRSLFEDNAAEELKVISTRLSELQSKVEAGPGAALQAEIQALKEARRGLSDEVKRLGEATAISGGQGWSSSSLFLAHAGFAAGVVVGVLVARLSR